jgi:RNA polymerase sigma factor for flagellar operon FliA
VTSHLDEDTLGSAKGMDTMTVPAQAPPLHMKTVALRTYGNQKTQAASEDRISEYLPLVNRIAHKVASYVRPPLSFEDLVSAGTVGLVKAVRDYDASHGAGFKTYAYIRIKGAILDELRSASMLPSGLNRQVKEVLELSRQITQRTGAAPTDEELANTLGISPDDISQLLDSARAQRFISLSASEQDGPSLDESLPARRAVGPDQQLERAELVDKLAQAISQLDARRRQTIVLYYQQHLTMKQIADVLKITESRVSQLHASALFSLSATLRAWKDEQF